MKSRLTLLILIILFFAINAHAQNVGIGEATPASKMTVKGNLSVGTSYSQQAAPANGAIIQGNVGIGTNNPSQKFQVSGGSILTDGAIAASTITIIASTAAFTTGTTASSQIRISDNASATANGNLTYSATAIEGQYLWITNADAQDVNFTSTSPATTIATNTTQQFIYVNSTWQVVSAATGGTAGGDLSGTYPNPSIGASTVNSTKIVDGTIVDADINAAAAINRSKLASGSANHVLINDGSGVISSEAQLALSRGGTNAGLTAVNGGAVYSGATGLGITAAGTSGQVLTSNGTAAPTWNAITGLLSGGTTNYIPKWSSATALSSTSLVYDNGSNVGVNTNAPNATFDVLATGGKEVMLGGGATTGSEIKFAYNGIQHFSIYNSGNNKLTIAQTSSNISPNQAGTALMTVDGSGNVNIPVLAVSAGVYTDASKNLTTTAPTSGNLGYWTRSSTNLYNTTLTDKVGIGTNAPASLFSVNGKAQFGDNNLTNNDTNDDVYVEKNGNYTQVHLYNTDGVSTDINAYLSMNRTGAGNGSGNANPGLNLWTSSAHPIRFATNAAERMVITAAGNIGVGNTNPFAAFQVNHNAVPPSSGNITGGLAVSNGSTGVSINMGVFDGATKYSWIQSAYVNNAGTTQSLALNPIGGNVGINTTTPGLALTIAGGSNVFGVDNTACFLAKNSSGSYEGYIWPRWSDNVMYMNFGSAGLNIRNNASTNVMFMSNSGNIGINNTNPTTARLVITGSSTAEGIDLASSDQYANFRVLRNSLNAADKDMFIGYGSGATSALHLYTNNFEGMTMRNYCVGVWNANPTGFYPLEVLGTIYCNGLFNASDIRFKKNIQPLSNSLTKVLQMQGVSYNWKTEEFPERHFTNDQQIGFIAQDLEKICPDMVKTDSISGYKGVNYNQFAPILVEAIKEQQKTIDQQRDSINALQTNNAATTKELLDLKATLAALQAQMNAILTNSNSAK